MQGKQDTCEKRGSTRPGNSRNQQVNEYNINCMEQDIGQVKPDRVEMPYGVVDEIRKGNNGTIRHLA